MVFVDPEDPLKGFLFDVRINEDFKLSTGTWVSVGPLRMKFLTHFRGLAQEVVVAGRDRDFVAALVFPVPGADPARFQVSLEEFAALSTGSSTCIERILLLDEAPSADAMEITDKGSINQKAVLKNRAILVEELYRGSPRVIEIRGGKP